MAPALQQITLPDSSAKHRGLTDSISSDSLSSHRASSHGVSSPNEVSARVFSGTSTEPITTSRDEMNLAEFPLAVLSTRANPKVKTLEFRDSQRLPSGEVVERQWIITGADKFGLPTATDDDVLLGLMRLSMDQGFRNRKVFFTRYELLGILRWTTEGRSYSRLTKSLDRLSGVRIRAANAFFDNSAKAYQTRNFGIIDAYEMNDGRGSKALSSAESAKSYFIWSEALFQSFKAGFIKKLDLSLYFTLRSAVSRRLYRYLDKHFYYKSCVEKPLVNFAFDKLGLSRSYQYISQIKQQIEPACDELVSIGFLSQYEFLGRGGETTVKFHAGANMSRQKQTVALPLNVAAKAYQPQQTNDIEGPKRVVTEALLSRGIHLSQAKRLLADKSDAELGQIDKIISYYDSLVSANDIKVSKNRVGFLYRAVENPHKFVLPKNFEDRGGNSNAEFSKVVRPERRLFSEKVANAQKPELDLEKKAYQEYISSAVERYRVTVNAAAISEVSQQVETKMSCFRTVLDRKSFSEALDGCVRDELASRLRLDDFATWKMKHRGK